MATERGWFIGPGDKVLAMDANGKVTFDRGDLTEQDLLEATVVDDDPRKRCEVRHVTHASYILGADGTKFTPSGSVCLQYYGTTNPRGYYEMWAFGQWPSGVVTAEVEYIEQGADNGRPWHAAGLTWVKQ